MVRDMISCIGEELLQGDRIHVASLHVIPHKFKVRLAKRGVLAPVAGEGLLQLMRAERKSDHITADELRAH